MQRSGLVEQRNVAYQNTYRSSETCHVLFVGKVVVWWKIIDYPQDHICACETMKLQPRYGSNIRFFSLI